MDEDRSLPPEVTRMVERMLLAKFTADPQASPDAVCQAVAEDLQREGAPFSLEMVRYIYRQVMAS